jgi:hypothetical protein
MKTEKTEIEKATEALIAAIDAERARLPDSGKVAKRAEDRLLRVCKKSIDAIDTARSRVYDNRRAREWKEDEPARLKRRQEYELKQQVLSAGYRAMATKLHPDAGGTHEEMVRLNQLRDKKFI